METMEKYNPFGVDGFSLLTDKHKKKFLVWNNGKYKFPIGPLGYIPKSGLVFQNILKNVVKGKHILDLGCGEMGIISLFSLIFGAKEITAVDIDDKCLDWLNYIKKTYLFNTLNVLKSDMFQNINKKFDVSISNPPIIPIPITDNKTVHDSGGPDGRSYITKIMHDALIYLNADGHLYLSAFSFLGTDTSTGPQISLKEYGLSLGYSSFEIVERKSKILSETSVTFQQLPYIKTIYPNMSLSKKEGKIAVEFQILHLHK